MTEQAQSVKANRLGHACPPWCVADHDKILIADMPSGKPLYSDAHSGLTHQVDGAYASAHAIRRLDDSDIILAAAGGACVIARVAHRSEVEDLASFVERVARMTPAQADELAGAIRAVAEEVLS